MAAPIQAGTATTTHVFSVEDMKIARDAFDSGDYKAAIHAFEKLRDQTGLAIWDADLELARRRLMRTTPPCFSILDEISEVCWADVMSLHPLLPNSAQRDLQQNPWPVFVESVWRGPNNVWLQQMANLSGKSRKSTKLDAIIQQARKTGHKIIFWNKEDPLHFDHFKHVAQMSDVILTTDSNCIPRYKILCQHAQIGSLKFAANVRICNPVGRLTWKKSESICFAGTNYVGGHNDRVIQLKILLPLIESFSGVIYNRGVENIKFSFPERYNSYLRPPVPFKEMARLYRRYRFFINVNTITDSPTMLARRVYELLASGTLVISWPSKALEEQFQGIVLTASTTRRAQQLVEDYSSNEFKWLRHAHIGYREVMTKHTYSHRLRELGEYMHFQLPNSCPRISILLATMRPQYIEHIASNICCQNYTNLEVIISTEKFNGHEREKLAQAISHKRPDIPITFIDASEQLTLGDRYNKMARTATGEYLAKFDDDDFYFPNYLTDLILPFSYTDAGIVGKWRCFFWYKDSNETFWRENGSMHSYSTFVSGATMLWRRALMEYIKFPSVKHGEDSQFQNTARDLGISIYAADPFNFAVFRTDESSYHTWKTEQDLRTRLQFVSKGFCKDLIIV